MIPAQLLKEAEAWASNNNNVDIEYGRYEIAINAWEACFARLCEMSEAPNEIEATKWARSDLHDVQFANQWEARMFGHIAGQKYKSRLSQAALLKAREDYIKTIKLQGEKVERLEKRLREALHGEFDAYDTGFNGSADEYIEREVSQALGEAE